MQVNRCDAVSAHLGVECVGSMTNPPTLRRFRRHGRRGYRADRNDNRPQIGFFHEGERQKALIQFVFFISGIRSHVVPRRGNGRNKRRHGSVDHYSKVNQHESWGASQFAARFADSIHRCPERISGICVGHSCVRATVGCVEMFNRTGMGRGGHVHRRNRGSRRRQRNRYR